MTPLISRRSLLIASPFVVAAAATPFLIHRKPKGFTPRTRDVCVFDHSKAPLKIKHDKLIDILQQYVDNFVGPVWGVRAKLHWTKAPQSGAMNIALMDALDIDANAIAYHDVNPKGTPYAEIDVAYAIAHSGELAWAITHELGEMLVNPGTNLWAGNDLGDAQDDDKLRALEIADPVQEVAFKIDGVAVSNFVFPAYFEPWNDGQIDVCGVLDKPGSIAEGGYQIMSDRGAITEITNPSLSFYKACYRRRFFK